MEGPESKMKSEAAACPELVLVAIICPRQAGLAVLQPEEVPQNPMPGLPWCLTQRPMTQAPGSQSRTTDLSLSLVSRSGGTQWHTGWRCGTPDSHHLSAKRAWPRAASPAGQVCVLRAGPGGPGGGLRAAAENGHQKEGAWGWDPRLGMQPLGARAGFVDQWRGL